MSRRQITGCVIALHASALIGVFALFSGLRQLHLLDSYFVPGMVTGLALALFGLFLMSDPGDSASS